MRIFLHDLITDKYLDLLEICKRAGTLTCCAAAVWGAKLLHVPTSSTCACLRRVEYRKVADKLECN